MFANRREFLIGAGVAGSAGLLDAGARAVPVPGVAWHPLQDAERRRLVQMAHFGRKQPVSGRNGVAISTHPLATRAAIDMLQAGGNAVDAICAASLAQTVVEPHMTTITGVFSLLHYEAATGRTTHLNCTSNAPLNMEGIDVTRLDDAVRDGRGVATPGYWAGWEAAMTRWGALPRRQVMAPAIHYAREGFEVHPFLWGLAFEQLDRIGSHPQGREMFLPGGAFLRPGDTLYQHRYADLLERLAEDGSDYYYRGAFADKICAAVQAAGGHLTRADFEAYRPIWAEPVRTRYRDLEVVAASTPDYGGNLLVEVLNILDLVDLRAMGPAARSPETALLMIKAINAACFDAVRRNFGVTEQTAEQAMLRATAEARLAQLRSADEIQLFTDAVRRPNPAPGTTSLSVVDKDGNIATMLHSCMSYPWSNGIFIDGVSLCAAAGHYLVGMPRSGGRIFNRIVANIMFRNGRPVLTSGSPSTSLLENVVQNITNIVDFGMPVAQSVELPRFGGLITDARRFMIEEDVGEAYLQTLSSRGVPLQVIYPRSWTNASFEAISIDTNGVAHACGDPRRTAVALAA